MPHGTGTSHATNSSIDRGKLQGKQPEDVEEEVPDTIHGTRGSVDMIRNADVSNGVRHIEGCAEGGAKGVEEGLPTGWYPAE